MCLVFSMLTMMCLSMDLSASILLGLCGGFLDIQINIFNCLRKCSVTVASNNLLLLSLLLNFHYIYIGVLRGPTFFWKLWSFFLIHLFLCSSDYTACFDIFSGLLYISSMILKVLLWISHFWNYTFQLQNIYLIILIISISL